MKSYTIIIATDSVDEARLATIAVNAGNLLAVALDDGTNLYEVDIIEGTFDAPLSGDNIDGHGRRA